VVHDAVHDGVAQHAHAAEDGRVGAPAGQHLAELGHPVVVHGHDVAPAQEDVHLVQRHPLALGVERGGVQDQEEVAGIPVQLGALPPAHAILHRQRVEVQPVAQQLLFRVPRAGDVDPHQRRVGLGGALGGAAAVEQLQPGLERDGVHALAVLGVAHGARPGGGVAVGQLLRLEVRVQRRAGGPRVQVQRLGAAEVRLCVGHSPARCR